MLLRSRLWNTAASSLALRSAPVSSSFLVSKPTRISSPTKLSATTALFSTTTNMPLAQVRVISNDKLYVSEPPPQWFGNGANTPNDPSWTNANWLKSRFHFSFAEYNNPRNSDFGVLRVMNDDLVQPARGFGTHPHQNMEIITYIVHGKLTHADSMTNKESLGRGSIQFMTAGRGVSHSEANDSPDQPLRFIQTWIIPEANGLTPNYGSYCGDTPEAVQARKDSLQHLVSNAMVGQAPVLVNQNINAYASEMTKLNETLSHTLEENEQAYLLCIEGSVQVNGKTLKKYDACEIMGSDSESTELNIQAVELEQPIETSPYPDGVAHILLFTMPLVEGSGRGDL